MSGSLAITPAIQVRQNPPERATATPVQTPVATTPPNASTLASANPGMHLDPALNLVVLQFFDSKGNVTQSIPSQKQLKAYQQDVGLKPAPAGETG